MTVIEMSKHKKSRWVSGEIVCLNCRHKWIAVIEVSSELTDFLECPKCKTMKGVFVYPFLPTDNELVFFCDCGSEIGYHTKHGFNCCKCGKIHSNDNFMGQ